jgi:lipoate-protein ligase A
MAIDETLLNQVISGQSPNIIRFYKWNRTTASIGNHQSLSAEIDFDFAENNNIDVVRRISGGGAVLHDCQNEITYAIICKIKDIPPNTKTKRKYGSNIPKRYIPILESIASGLEKIGVPIDVEKIHCPALLTSGRKISGSAQIIRNNVLLQHGTILLDVNPEFMYKVLKAPIGVSYTKMVQSVRSKVIGIKQFLGKKIPPSNLTEYIISNVKEGFVSFFNIKFKTQNLTESENKQIKNLVEEKYASPTWLEKYA